MRRFVTLALASASMFAMTAGDAAAAGKNPPTSCGMGNVVSEAVAEVGGLGKYFHGLGASDMGNDVLQPFHEVVIKRFCNEDLEG